MRLAQMLGRGADSTPESRGPTDDLTPRGREILEQHRHAHNLKTDRMFLVLLLAQWAFAVVVALVISPFTWAGKVHAVHQHVWTALIMGGVINSLPILLIFARPGRVRTRHVIAVAQMLWSGLFIHLTGGRIETHFHVFGSLAFLAFYRDWRLLVTATLAVAADHLVRGLVWPESVYGILNPEWWRFLEHAFWVAFENTVLVIGCLRSQGEMQRVAGSIASLERVNAEVEERVTERTAELGASREQYRALVETASVVPWEMAPGRMSYVGPQVEAVLGWSQEACLAANAWYEMILAEDRQRVMEVHGNGIQADDPFELEYRMTRPDGQIIFVRDVVAPGSASDGGRVLRGLMFDVTERRELESQLVQAQKLESVGRLAAGIAHEINTPVQFVGDSVHFVRSSMQDLLPLLGHYERLRVMAAEGQDGREQATELARTREDADTEYLLENIPRALDRALEGLERVTTIVRAMKDFAHPDSTEQVATDLNRAIESTLIVARNEYKYVADVETNLGDLPPVRCRPGEVNQALLNIIVNAGHAIADVVGSSGERGRIEVRSWRDGAYAAVSIRDTGGGIPTAIRNRVFDPFFTTKIVGRGTGQGLFIARSIVQEKHGGSLTFDSPPGEGTTFVIRLPVEGLVQAAAQRAA